MDSLADCLFHSEMVYSYDCYHILYSSLALGEVHSLSKFANKQRQQDNNVKHGSGDSVSWNETATVMLPLCCDTKVDTGNVFNSLF